MAATISIIVLAILCLILFVRCENLVNDLHWERHFKKMYEEDGKKYLECEPYIPICMKNKKEIIDLHEQ